MWGAACTKASAVVAPAGPPPTMTTSLSRATKTSSTAKRTASLIGGRNGAQACDYRDGSAGHRPWVLVPERLQPVFVMKRPAILLCVAGLCVAPFSLPRSASAIGPVDVEVAARVGGGTNPVNVPPSSAHGGPPQVNALGFGLGARAGASFSGLYGGLSFMYYLGERQPP